ncbi:MAG TPA: type II toxin-antitoxin system RelE/ParE family toxin [Bryobacteraceae bacterium]
MSNKEREVLYYQTVQGDRPFRDWRKSLSDIKARQAVDARITRFMAGNFGDSEPIGQGASESRIDLGPGWRIYYGVDGDKVVLLYGGDKSTQAGDINTALAYWNDYRTRSKVGRKKKL